MVYHWFDVAAALFFLACVVYSSFRGFVKELFCVLAWVVGYVGAVSLHPLVAPVFKTFLKTTILIDLVSFFSLFVTLYISVRLLGFVLRHKVGLKHISPFIDHGAGALMGAAKSLFFLAIFLSPLNIFPEVKERLIQNSISAGIVINVSQGVMSLTGAKFRAVTDKAKKGASKLVDKVGDKISKKSFGDLIKKEQKEEVSSHEAISEEDRKGMDKLLESLD